MNLSGFLTKFMTPFWNPYEKLMTKLIDARLMRFQNQVLRLITSGASQSGAGQISQALALPLRDPDHRWQTLQIGITDLCNLLCSHCTRIPQHPGLQGTLSFVDFARYLSCFSPNWFDELLISDWGEPTIVKPLLTYLYHAKRNGWDNVHFFTNGTSSDEALFEEIIAHRLLGRLFVSVEAADEELYASIRKQPLSNFRRFMDIVAEYRESYKSPMQLFFNVVCMKANMGQLPLIVEMAANYGVDCVLMVHLSPVVYLDKMKGKLCTPDQHLDAVDRSEVLAVFDKVIKTAEKRGLGINLPEPFPELTGQSEGATTASGPLGGGYKCGEPFRWVQISFGGDVYPCCQMGKTYSMGNLNDLDFYSIWTNLRYRRLLDGLRETGEPLDICKRCNMLAGKNF